MDCQSIRRQELASLQSKTMKFETAFALLLGHEGEFSDHPDDPGGKTRYGVTEAVARETGYKGDMRELPLELAQVLILL